MANKKQIIAEIERLIKKIEKHSELQKSVYVDSRTKKPIRSLRLIDEDVWKELKYALVSNDEAAQ